MQLGRIPTTSHPHRTSSTATHAATTLLYAGFNQDYSHLAVGTPHGFRILTTDPLSHKLTREFGDGGIGMVEMLFRTNYLALVGGGKDPKWPSNKVILWDEAKSKVVAELEFRSTVLGVRLRRDCMLVVLINKVFVYSLSAQPKRLLVVETGDNPRGVCCVANATEGIPWMVVPGRQPGHVQVIDLHHALTQRHPSTSGTPPAPSESRGRRTAEINVDEHALGEAGITRRGSTTSATSFSFVPAQASIIPAHTSPLAALAMTLDGTLVATASDKGTLVRVFDTASGRLKCELRRGADRAEIYSMGFSELGVRRLVVASDKGTVHVFNVEDTSGGGGGGSGNGGGEGGRPGTAGSGHSGEVKLGNTDTTAGGGSLNRVSKFGFMRELLPKYFSSEWSFAHVRLPGGISMETGKAVHGEDEGARRCIVGWSPKQANAFFVIVADGGAFKYSFDPVKGGECHREAYVRFMGLGKNEDEFSEI